MSLASDKALLLPAFCAGCDAERELSRPLVAYILPASAHTLLPPCVRVDLPSPAVPMVTLR